MKNPIRTAIRQASAESRKRERAARKTPPQVVARETPCSRDVRLPPEQARYYLPCALPLGHVGGCVWEPRPDAPPIIPAPSTLVARDWTAIGLRLDPEELAELDAFRKKGIFPLSRAESARACVRRALGLGRKGGV